jgi:hypothetical protein
MTRRLCAWFAAGAAALGVLCGCGSGDGERMAAPSPEVTPGVGARGDRDNREAAWQDLLSRLGLTPDDRVDVTAAVEPDSSPTLVKVNLRRRKTSDDVRFADSAYGSMAYSFEAGEWRRRDERDVVLPALRRFKPGRSTIDFGLYANRGTRYRVLVRYQRAGSDRHGFLTAWADAR